MTLPSYIWHLRGKNQEGPTVVVLGGTHGDELTGLEVVRKLLARFDLLKKPAGIFDRDDIVGNLYVGFGNPEAILRCTRSASDGKNTDLNRAFTPDELNSAPQSDDRADLRRARELAPLLASANFLFDIHGTSSPSEPFVCFGNDTPARRNIYRLIPVRYILTVQHHIYIEGELGTTDEHVARHGGMGLCYEAGQAREVEKMDAILGNTVDLLHAVHAVNPAFMERFAATPRTPAVTTQEVFTIVEKAVAKSDIFTYEPGMDHGWKMVEPNTLMGHFDDGTEERTRRGGMLLFAQAPYRIKKGEGFYYLAEKIG